MDTVHLKATERSTVLVWYSLSSSQSVCVDHLIDVVVTIGEGREKPSASHNDGLQ